MPPKYRLIYFNAQARGEVARLLFAVAEVEFEDVRIERWTEWPPVKQKYPNGQLPVLEIDGKMYGQSYAHQRYLAREFGLAGKTPLDQLRADMIVDTTEDLLRPVLPSFYLNDDDPEKARIVKEYVEEKFPVALQNLEKMLIENNGGDGFFVGDELTWADLNFTNAIEWTENLNATADWSKYPKLAALRERVLKVPKIAEWIAKRPKSIV